jgi:hypothetical protein
MSVTAGRVKTMSLRVRLHEYYELCKPRVVMLIVFTAVVGMFLAVPGLPPLAALIWGTLGIGLQAASAAAVNQIIDRNIDARMARTCGRPLVTGTLTMGESVAFATVIGLLGFAMLWVFVNPLTAVLTQLTLIGYAGVYTMYLKRATPQNIVIGGAAGAAPPVLGWAAATGEVHAHALILFAIIFVWTPPHFCHPRHRIHAHASAVVHGAAAGGDDAAVRDRDVGLALSGRRDGARADLPQLRRASEVVADAGPADAHLRLLDRLSDGNLHAAAAGSLPRGVAARVVRVLRQPRPSMAATFRTGG